MPAAMASWVERSSIGFAFEEHLALVGGVQPVEDVHQGRLAGPVLTEKGDHLAGGDSEG